MARYTQTQQLNILLNSEQARANIQLLEREIESLNKKIEKANAAGDKNVDKLQRQRKSLQQTLTQLTKDTRGYEDVLKNLNGSTISQLEKAFRALKREVRNTNPELEEFANKRKQLKLLQDRIKELNGQAAQTESIFTRMSDKFNRYFGVVSAGIASVTGLSLAFRSAAESAAEMDDIYSDVMKSTGLTREEVVALNEEFKKMDTRTSREALNGLAYEAGKLGISAKEDVLAFVRAADQINVALGEDLGEGAITQIGKIAAVFGLIDEMGMGQSLISIGSAINALGQDSTAAEGYLVEFAQRLAGVGAQARMSVQDLLGYASGLDQSAMNVEMAATAFQTFIMNMFSNTATFARYANMEVEDFARLLNTDVNSAVMTVLASLNEAGGFQQLVPIFKDMGADGARAVSVLASMASNLDAVRDAQALSNEEFEKATSLANEFETKNNNRMANLEKARKAFKDTVIEFGETLSPVMLNTTNLSTLAIKFLSQHGKEVLALAATYATLFAAYKLYSSWSKILTSLEKTRRVAILGLSAATNALTGNTTRAAEAFKKFKGALGGGWIGLAAAAIGAAVVGITKLVEKQREATKATRDFYAETGILKLEADSLLKVIENSGPSTDTYRTALEKLQETYGPYIASLINENGELTDIAAAREIINKEIERSIGLRVRQEELDRVTSKSLEKQAGQYEKLVKSIMKAGDVSEETARIVADDAVKMIKDDEDYVDIYKRIIDTVDGSTAMLGIRLRRLFDEYRSMVSDIDKTNKKFSSLIPSVPNDNGGNAPGKKSPVVITAQAENEDLEKTFEDRLAIIDAEEAAEQLLLKRSYAARRLSQSDYENLSELMTLSYLQRRSALYMEYGKDNVKIEEKYLDILIKRMEDANRTFDRLSKKAEEALKLDLSGIEEALDDAFNDLYGKELSDFENLMALREQLQQAWGNPLPNPIDIDAFRADIEGMKELYDQGFVSYNEFLNMVQNRRGRFAEDILQTTVGILDKAANLANSLQQVELAKLDVQMNKELAMYGTTADKRAEIEAKFEQKKLDLQLKYADMNMGIQIAQAIASGSLASVQAWNAAAGNPVLAGVIMAMIAASTAMQVAAIVAQRNALRNQTLDNSGSSSVVTRYVKEYSDGGYTDKDPNDMTPVGIVHANEWVAPASMLRSYPQLFSGLEKLRSGVTDKVPAVPFATGGYTSPQDTKWNMNSDLMISLIDTMRKINKRLEEPAEAYVVLSQLQAQQKRLETHKKAGSR